MRPAAGGWDSLRLAAKAADRAKAAEELRPAFEERLRELGYGSLAIAHAFSTLTTPPQQHASLVRVRVSWAKDSTSLFERPAHELRITL
jgi:hypothetical protein